MIRLKSQLHFLHVLKDAEPQARHALLTIASDDLVKTVVECAINCYPTKFPYGNDIVTNGRKA